MKFLPYFFSAAGDITIPARSASTPVSGTYGWSSVSRTVSGPVAFASVTGASSVERADPGRSRWRSSEVTTAGASSRVPSLNLRPGRSRTVTVRPSAEVVGSDAASCGTKVPSSSMS